MSTGVCIRYDTFFLASLQNGKDKSTPHFSKENIHISLNMDFPIINVNLAYFLSIAFDLIAAHKVHLFIIHWLFINADPEISLQRWHAQCKGI